MDIQLPPHLEERVEWLKGGSSPAGSAGSPSVTGGSVSSGPGRMVLYWMHNALRAHDNPALDTAIYLARQNGLPLLIAAIAYIMRPSPRIILS
ncbi:MAG: deoxyribodipyrimidine photo-lyase, partial [Planctomycetota bacterium]